MEKIDMKEKIQLHDFVIKEDEIWFTINACNKVFHYNIKRKELCSVGKFPKEVLNKPNLFCTEEEYKNRLFFIPFISNNIQIYDIKEREFETIELNTDEKVVCKYFSCFREKNFLYLLPVCCKHVLKINLDNYEQEYIWNIEQFLNMKSEESVNVFFNNEVCKCGDYFVGLISETTTLVVFEPDKKKVQEKRLGFKFNNIISICNEGNNIFCLERSTGNIVCWNMDSNKITYTEINYENITEEILDEIINIRHQGRVYSVFKNNSIYLCPDLGNAIIRIELEAKSAYTVIKPTENLKKKYLNSKMYLVNDKLSFFYGAESAFITIDEKGTIEKERIVFKESEIISLKKEMLEEVVMEEDPRICDITLLIERCSGKERRRELKKIGDKIFTEIKGDC